MTEPSFSKHFEFAQQVITPSELGLDEVSFYKTKLLALPTRRGQITAYDDAYMPKTADKLNVNVATEYEKQTQNTKHICLKKEL